MSREFTPDYDEYLGGSRPDNLEYISVLYEDLTEKALFGEISFDVTDRWQITRRRALLRLHVRSVERPGAAAGRTRSSAARRRTRSTSILEPTLPFRTTAARCSSSTRRIGSATTCWGTSRSARAIESARRTASRCARLRCRPNQNVCALPDEFSTSPTRRRTTRSACAASGSTGRLTLNGALYYIDWQDPQLASATVNGAQPITNNGEGAETTGFEVAIDAARHRPLQPRLQLLAHERPSSRKLRRT